MKFDFLLFLCVVFIVGVSMAQEETMTPSVNNMVVNEAKDVQIQPKKETPQAVSTDPYQKKDLRYVDPSRQVDAPSWKYQDKTKADQWKYKDVKRQEIKNNKTVADNTVEKKSRSVKEDKNFIEHPNTQQLKFGPARNVVYDNIKNKEKMQELQKEKK